MKGSSIQYSDKELSWIEAHKSDVRKLAHMEFVQKFRRPDVSLQNYASLCKRKKWLTGRTGQYVPGQAPPNKGKKMPYNANSAKTQFKKGQCPHNTKYAGHERISKDGYVEISVEEKNPHTGYSKRYVLKHRWLWIKKNGPLEADMVLKCLDGNKLNTDPSNWDAIPRAMLPRLNGIRGRNYDAAEPEIKPIIMAATKLEHQARAKTKTPTRITEFSK